MKAIQMQNHNNNYFYIFTTGDETTNSNFRILAEQISRLKKRIETLEKKETRPRLPNWMKKRGNDDKDILGKRG